MVGLIRFGLQHRPYEPATPLGLSVGLDISFEVTLFQIPSSLFSDIAAGDTSAAPISALPMAKLHLHKGVSAFMDVGGSFFYFDNSGGIVGGDVKVMILHGEEGPTISLRACYTYTDFNYDGIEVKTYTFSPQILASRQMDFADPYLGMGLEMANGGVVVSAGGRLGAHRLRDTRGADPQHAGRVADGRRLRRLYFGGVSMRIPNAGVRLTLEGSYNSAGESTMGTKVGFTF